MDGIILINKPSGMSSFGVVARVRRKLSQVAGKKVKVGHTGTLDPFASGLMIIVVGSYCKRASEFSKLDKTYDATLYLGKTSSTGDPEGEITEVSALKPTQVAVEAALQKFTGRITQIPPLYSAIKINGVRAYKLARRGEVAEVPARKVSIFSLGLLSYEYPEIVIRTHVSSGTYIRTLVQDVGKMLGTGAYTLELRRTKVGKWDIAKSHTLHDDEGGESLKEKLINP